MREAATICPARCKLTLDLLTLKAVSESRVTCPTSIYANFSLPRRLCSRLRPDVRDRQMSDRRQTRIIAYASALLERGIIMGNFEHGNPDMNHIGEGTAISEYWP